MGAGMICRHCDKHIVEDAEYGYVSVKGKRVEPDGWWCGTDRWHEPKKGGLRKDLYSL
jgi:hypothetical protein